MLVEGLDDFYVTSMNVFYFFLFMDGTGLGISLLMYESNILNIHIGGR